MRYLILLTFIIFMANTFAQASTTVLDHAEKIIFCKSDSEHLGLLNIYLSHEQAILLAEAKEVSGYRIYVLSLEDVNNGVVFHGDHELVGNDEIIPSNKRFTVGVSNETLENYEKHPFVAGLNYESGRYIELYCEAAVKLKKKLNLLK